MDLDALTIGDAVIDAFLTLADLNQEVSLDRIHHRLSVVYGEKILLSACDFFLGGNASNVAVGLSRAGLKTAILAEVTKDEFAQKILNSLQREKVLTEFLVRGEGQSSFSIGLNFQGERTLFVEHHDRSHDFHLDHITTRAIYLTSLGHSWEHVYKKVAGYIQQQPETLFAFNPGSTQFQDGSEKFAYLLPLVSLLFVNKEEAEKIVGKKAEIPELLAELHAKGIRIVSLTDGEAGAYASDENNKLYHQAKVDCPVVERTGAGDAYASGFLAAYLREKDIPTAMLWGVHNAAAVIGKIGAEAGLLRAEDFATL
ncbi:MAG TPA: carbohydrate kinase family protein [Patescibacteria group bacterium]|nr:carbohydrate kinase family protein [Patescibacteria group bacterium]